MNMIRGEHCHMPSDGPGLRASVPPLDVKKNNNPLLPVLWQGLYNAAEMGGMPRACDEVMRSCAPRWCLHLTGVLELRLVAKGLVLGMRCTSVSLRNKWTTLLGKLLRRISTSLHFVLHRWPAGPGSPGLGSAERAEKAADIACDALSLLRPLT